MKGASGQEPPTTTLNSVVDISSGSTAAPPVVATQKKDGGLVKAQVDKKKINARKKNLKRLIRALAVLTFQERGIIGQHYSLLNHDNYVFLDVYPCCITCGWSQIYPCLPAIRWVNIKEVYIGLFLVQSVFTHISRGKHQRGLHRSLLGSICFHAYQQVSYMILERVSPVTHSVGNCVKRVVVIGASIFFFSTPISLMNSMGTGLALTEYSYTHR